MQLHTRVLALTVSAALFCSMGACGERKSELTSSEISQAPVVEASTAAAAKTCRDPTVDDLVGSVWTINGFVCGEDCDHRHYDDGHTVTFTKDDERFDVGGHYRTEGGALEVVGDSKRRLKGPLQGVHVDGQEEDDHWLLVHIYPHDCTLPNPYRLDIGVCSEEPNNDQKCNDGKQHGGVGHAHP